MAFAAALTLAPAAARADAILIDASGTIASSCSVAMPANGNFGTPNLAGSGSVQATATVTCNTGFKVSATSLNGAIKTASPASPGFTNSLPYALTVSVPLDTGAPISATCAASALSQAGCVLSPTAGLSSGGRTAVGASGQGQAATLTAAWTLPAQRLVAGTYADTITISVTAQP